MIDTATTATTEPWAGLVRLERLPGWIADRAPMDVADAFRHLPGLAVLESARPGRRARWTYLSADPLDRVQLAAEALAGGRQVVRDTFAGARRALARLAVGSGGSDADAPPFRGGLIGYLGYDLGLALEPRRTVVGDDQGLPTAQLALHDWVVAWDRGTGSAWLAGRAVDGETQRLDDRLAEVRRLLARGIEPHSSSPGSPEPGSPEQDSPASAAPMHGSPDGLEFRSSLDRRTFEDRVEEIRNAIARGDIYQANLTRRLQAPYEADPWPLYRELRTGDPSLFAAYLALDPDATGHPRAVVSASPEPFLMVDDHGNVAADPIKGTRPRGRTRERDRALARELLLSAKDRAENTMIVDVLRNDLGRVCRPGSVRVPRLCRLERTAAVQHLVSTVTGRLRSDLDVFDLLTAAFPGGSITGAPKLRAMELLEELEPVRRGPYTGALGWFGPDGSMGTSILIRSFVADGLRLTLNVGGGITWRSDPAAEWDETVAKASGPLGAIGGVEVEP